MRMRKKQTNRNLRALIITLVVLVALGILSKAENSPVSTALNAVSRGMFKLTASATASADSASTEELAAQAEALSKENAELRKQLADYIDVKKENETLWKYFGLKKENPSYDVTPANVIRRDVNDDFYSFTLDAGTTVGVHVNAPVVTEKGLVGWVYQADAVSCKVKTILSPDTKAGVSDKLSGDSGILSGSVSLCDKNLTSMNKLVENHTVKEGDMIVTSGTGGVYPSGLLIGEVQSIEFNKYDASRYAIIKPYEDVRKITSAAVITDFDDKGKVVKSDEKKN